MEIFYSGKFARDYKKLPLEIKRAAEKKELVFRKDPLDLCLKTHKLKGALSSFYSFSINQKYRIIFEITKDKKIWLHSIGDHSIYKLWD